MLKNYTNGSRLDIPVYKANSLREKTLGIMLYKKPQALVIKTRFGIHTFFIDFPIDVVILNKTNKVVAFKKNLKPNRVFLWNPNYSKVLELPAGTIGNLKIKKKDTLGLEY